MEKIEMNSLPLLAEFLGTFLLVLAIIAFASGNTYITAGILAVLILLFGNFGNADIGAGLVIGGTLALIVVLIGSVSGAHVNPAVSLSMFLKGALSFNELVAYIVVQLLGGATALYTFRAFA
jgi:aquaporin Z